MVALFVLSAGCGCYAQKTTIDANEVQSLSDGNPYLYLCATAWVPTLMTQLLSDGPRIKVALLNAERTRTPTPRGSGITLRSG